MGQLSDRINNMEESATIAMAQKSRELQAQGKDIINLSLGEPDFFTPDFIKEAAKKGIDDNYSKYMPVPGYQDLREAICHKFKRDNNLEYTPNQIVVSTGAKQSIANVVLSLVNPGDEVIIPAPYWVSYIEIAKLAEGKVIEVSADIENDFKITPEQLEASITPKSKLMIFSTPCNPTGTFYTKEELKGLADVIAKHKNLSVICDEIYELINYEGQHESLAQFDNVKNQVITINGVSKGFAMTGWRIGYIGAPEWIAKACTKMQGQFTSGASSVSQRGAIAAVSADPSVTIEMRDAFRKRRDLVLEMLAKIDGVKCNVPKGAFYVFPDISSYFGSSKGDTSINNSSDMSMYLLTEANVAVVTGAAFGAPNCIRFSYAASEEQIIEAINRIKAALEQLNVPATQF